MDDRRLASLDFFRGLTVMAMIVVNNPGSWDHVYPPLLHAHWNGCTPTDLIFPFFLFIVGISIHFAYRSRRDAGLTRTVALRILRRGLTIFLCGMFLTWYTIPLSGMVDPERLAHLRIPGVLQRISIVFVVCTVIYFYTRWVAQLRITALLLLGYYLLMTLVPVPDGTPPNLEPGTNLAAWIDRLLLDGHLWSQSRTWDPEGVLSTVPAIGTGMLGILTAQLFDAIENPTDRVSAMFAGGGALMVAGLAWDMAFPMNKSLWTSSYVLYAGGLAMQVLAASHWWIDIHNRHSWIKPFHYFGMNAIFAFVASGFVAKTLIRIRVTEGYRYGVMHTDIFTRAGWSRRLPHSCSRLPSCSASKFFSAGCTGKKSFSKHDGQRVGIF